MPINHLIIGIDPGFSGAIALITPDLINPAASPTLIGCWDMPLIDEGANLMLASKRTQGGRHIIDADGLAQILEPYKGHIAMAIIERVTASPQMGVTSSFRFGEGYGTLTGVLSGLRLPRIIRTAPGAWKPAVGLTSVKSDSIAMANRLFPGTAYFGRTKHDRAEAALLAWYGYKMFQHGKTQLVASLF